jgi:hypothetical protein
MRRLFFGLALLASASTMAYSSNSTAQEKQKTDKVRAYLQPKEAGPDFENQGEYVGEVTENGKTEKVGLQLISKGDGKFQGRILRDGLPGDGWNGKDSLAITGLTNGDKVELDFDLKGEKNQVGTVSGGQAVLKKGEISLTLKKVERKSPTLGAKPPEGALVLFDKPEDLKANWNGGKIAELPDGKFLQVAGNVKTKKAFTNYKMHVEFRLPYMPRSSGQGRGNSGVYMQDRYEIQVLDSFALKGENNECGGIYTIAAPKVNMCLPPLQWQTYDIEFKAAEYDSAGKKTKNAHVTVSQNGTLIQENQEIPKSTGGGQDESPKPGPIQLQDHGDPVVYRNIWIVEQK